MAAAFFFMYPGPKLIWQFGELGYDLSINYPSGQDYDRLTPKPIRWNYYQDEWRRKLYKTFAVLINLRKSEQVFHSPDAYASMSVSESTKQIRLSHPSMEALIVGNFDVLERKINPSFSKTGNWYDYFSGETLTITDTSDDTLTLAPGEFHIYTDTPLPTLEEDILNSLTKTEKITRQFALAQNYPNPFNPTTAIRYRLSAVSQVELSSYNVLGQRIATLVNEKLAAGDYQVDWDASGFPSGIYYYRIIAGDFEQVRKMILIK